MRACSTSTAGPVANFVIAAFWLTLGVWTLAGSTPSPLRWIQLLGYLVLTVGFVLIGLRRLRARRSGG